MSETKAVPVYSYQCSCCMQFSRRVHTVGNQWEPVFPQWWNRKERAMGEMVNHVLAYKGLPEHLTQPHRTVLIEQLVTYEDRTT